MSYSLVRIIILVILVILFIFGLGKKINFKKKSTWGLLIVGGIVIYTALLFLPFEHLIFNFKSPESAFEYTQGQSKVFNYVDTDDCTYVLYQINGSGGYHITSLYKSQSGWRITLPWSDSFYKKFSVDDRVKSRIEIDVYHHPGAMYQMVAISQYLISSSADEKCLEIQNNSGNSFVKFYEDVNLIKQSGDFVYNRFYYSIASSEDEDYAVIIDGNEFIIN